jgi:hypothetical protein
VEDKNISTIHISDKTNSSEGDKSVLAPSKNSIEVSEFF